MTVLDLALPAVAALWGAAAGALLPRAAYRFSSPAGEQWRRTCPTGHPVKGWLGRGRCPECATAEGARGSADAPARGGEPTPTLDHGSAPARGDAPAPGAQPTAPSAQPTAPGAQPTAPSAQPTAPSAQPTAPSAQPTAPSAQPTAPGARPTAPAFDGQRTPPSRQLPRPLAAYGPRTTPLSLATALVCAALALATGARPELAAWLLLAPSAVLLAAVDFRVQRLPDPVTLPLAAAALALLGVATLLPEHAGAWLTSLYAALALSGAYFVLFLINPGGMGFGDVKLALGMGAVLGWYGWPTVLLGTFAGFLFGALYGGALVVLRRAGRKTAIAFGPFLIVGAFAGLLIGAYTA
ncbi:prepilin peptidase [Streptomyces sp. NPDC005917]|uniref:prepilin peptidase n=1 Tax=Streptomyces sp. NPDC005917 TaxID=3155347 RepID=UPI0033C3B1BF